MQYGFDSFGKLLMVVGCILFALGILIYFGGKWFPLGKLPGDLRWEYGSTGFYFPIMTSIILSIVLTVILNLFNRR